VDPGCFGLPTSALSSKIPTGPLPATVPVQMADTSKIIMIFMALLNTYIIIIQHFLLESKKKIKIVRFSATAKRYSGFLQLPRHL
jgi:hypothetical protein